MTMYSYSSNRHADPADISQNIEARVNDIQVRTARAKAAAQQRGNNVRECQGCGEPIDPARKAAVPSATHCIWCQEDNDHLSRLPGYGEPA